MCFLHDGRARTLIEAILWHDGEAAESRQRVLATTARERNALIHFVESL
ncbi:di-heme oxidoredictase family protein [Endozoicomonas sp. YOMI1]|nr:di-heme oxidoredictase family protein [Endozoicomonas sp. YOMI1]